jgi:hypothetical protein
MNTPDDLFPHATAQAPELVTARRELESCERALAFAQGYDCVIAANRDYEAALDRVANLEQLEAEAMRKEGR